MSTISIKNDIVLSRIEATEPGTKISVRGLASELDVSEGTVYKAIKEAEQRGLVEKLRGIVDVPRHIGIVHVGEDAVGRGEPAGLVLRHRHAEAGGERIAHAAVAADCAGRLGVIRTAAKDQGKLLGDYRITYYSFEATETEKAGFIKDTTSTLIEGNTVAVSESIAKEGEELIINGHLYTATNSKTDVAEDEMAIYVSSAEKEQTLTESKASVYKAKG